MDIRNCLFKFVNLRKTGNQIYTLKNLKENELYCQYFSDYNDPYESHFGMFAKWPCPYKETEKLRSLIEKIDPKNSKHTTNSIESMRRFIHLNQHLSDTGLKFAEELTHTFRVCSFTRRWNDILMWGHYGDGMRGVVLVFDPKELKRINSSRLVHDPNVKVGVESVDLRWVTYSRKIPTINSVGFLEAARVFSREDANKFSDKLLEVCALTKLHKWRYEQETRLIVGCDSDYEVKPIMAKYNSEALKGVIIGNKLSKEQVLQVAKSLPENRKMYTIRQNPRKYKLEIANVYSAKDVVRNGGLENLLHQ
ncbi:DUF2971 domain-containing protein [Pseudoteredinibacter isoporae]|uniref:DUF2971 domain-containing protein n=1 Tax=Pseudoteredinibacter isoporae TaxID=570281 RepID=UPI00310574A6